MRDKLIHDYDGIKLDVVWEVIQRELPALIQQMQALAAKLR